ncbi:hypothetical protein DM860_001755 [Cuscuta australis]|uniref:Protein COFACTOR ASSEMBLY OF COMPLEX C SUBUNIT B CCB3, chloroplastic n=1 Tax=Cuscuta australis TaxID=267555 RepID=A0A328E9U2_9ASTE|nr:hypothetical protein DM860_001755 [Cuscuta australis]
MLAGTATFSVPAIQSWPPARHRPWRFPERRKTCRLRTFCFLEPSVHVGVEEAMKSNTELGFKLQDLPNAALVDLDPATAKFAIAIVGPFLSAFSLMFIFRIVMSWYPNLPVGKFPYVIAYAPTEPFLRPTRKVIRPLGGVDVTPVVWFGMVSFLNEILVGPQGLLVLLSQQLRS